MTLPESGSDRAAPSVSLPLPLRILEKGVYRGPHLYSFSPMIRLMLDLGTLESWPSHRLPDFNARLLGLLPSLQAHQCSLGRPGGFVERLHDGTWLGHVSEHVALELQSLAGSRVSRGKTRSVKGRAGVYNVLFAYQEEKVGLLAGRLALQLVDSLLPPELRGVRGLDLVYRDETGSLAALNLPDGSFNLPAALETLSTLVRRTRLGPTTEALVQAARRRGIPVLRMDELSMIQLGHGKNQQRLRASITGQTSHVAVDAASNKNLTKQLLSDAGVPVPRGVVVRSADEAVREAARLGYPLVTKPLDGNHGRGVSTHLTTADEVRSGFVLAAQHSARVILEQHYNGHDHRILVVNGQVVAVAQRVPAQVIGNGVSTVQALIDEVNRDPRRGAGHEAVMTRIRIDAQVKELLAGVGLTLESVPAVGQTVVLRSTANLSTGGTAIDRTDEIHPANALFARRAAQAVGLDIAGIDFLAPDISQSVRDTGGGIVEVNAAPGFRMHLEPSEGQPRDVAHPVIEMLYPRGSRARIPILAVTGTNGKSTTARMVAHVLAAQGLTVGMTSTSGVYIGGELVAPGDATGPKSARMVLRDPTVDVAVIEAARGGMLREGLGFDRADVGAVLNITSDHLGLKGIDTLQDLARLKSLVVNVVGRRGHSILNADDPLTARMRRTAGGQVVYFSMHGLNKLRRHVDGGGLAVVLEDGEIVVYQGGQRLPIMLAAGIPATLGGLAGFNVQNALAASAMCFAHGIPLDDIRRALCTFTSSFEQSPGRLNVHDGHGFRVIVDYAHNPAGLAALSDLVGNLRPQYARTIGMVSIPGDRRNEDIQEMGVIAARTFDDLIFREAPDGRGRASGEVLTLLSKGALEAGFSPERMRRVLHEADAVDASLRMARPGDLVALMPTAIDAVWHQVQTFVPESKAEAQAQPSAFPRPDQRPNTRTDQMGGRSDQPQRAGHD
ncbi:cyanophycin synthetase [Deinococcus sp. QL22]|uniref:cyanophycin synthetase n=1 Tax=Deinococcus sp. QL22 TaxID=2939437 RepID=UPI0020178959|nr:cyanophycin synthetase [Deinococcus sp. QL22]UQN09713.1 cyanophycin synthetase [Deinococcus sp. QL22]